MTYSVKETTYRRADALEREDLLSIKDAAEALGMTMPGVIAAINRGELTEVVDDDALNPNRDRRFVLLQEVLEAATRRGLEDAAKLLALGMAGDPPGELWPVPPEFDQPSQGAEVNHD